MEEKKIINQNMNFARKEKFILWIFDEENLDIMDSWE